MAMIDRMHVPRHPDSVADAREDRAARQSTVERAAKVWSGQLVDLSGRNNLLYFKDLNRGTLDLASADPASVSGILAGRSVSITRLFGDSETARDDAIKRSRRIHNKADEHFEERGLQTLYVACGMATWTNTRGTATPAAPVLLCPARLVVRGAAMNDFELSLTGEMEVNQTLLHMLAADFDVAVDAREAFAQSGIDGAIDSIEELDVVYRWLTERAVGIAGFGISPRLVLGTFSYAKLPMVTDLENSVEAMLDHELICALAGDRDAQASLRAGGTEVSPSDPNYVSPADEFLILDADSSQNYVINAAVAGRNLTVKGPPGTGKSQTIANLISSLIARDKKVLFVAEKRAAIDAVLQRLDRHQLGDLVMDLHGTASSRRAVSAALQRTLASNGQLTKPDQSALHRTLQEQRQTINARVAALHQPREPWAVSVFDVQAQLLGSRPGLDTEVRLRGSAITELGEDAARAARAAVAAFADLGGLSVEQSASPWANARIVSAEQAQGAIDLLSRLVTHTIPAVTRALHDAATTTGLQPADSIGGWQQRLDLWRSVADCAEALDPAIYLEDLPALLAATEPMAAGAGARMSAAMISGDYRRARKMLKQLATSSLTTADVRQRCEQAAANASQWAAVSSNGGAPHAPADLDSLSATWDQLRTELAAVDEFLPGGGWDTVSLADAERGCRDLLGDQVTLRKLPELHRLGERTRRAGLSDLVSDLTARRIASADAAAVFDFCWWSSILEHVSLGDPLVATFDGEGHGRDVEIFREADRQHIVTTAERVRRMCAEHATRALDEHAEQAALVRHQAGLKRKQLPIRHLFAAAPEAMLALKPCWAMSPLLVSQVLPADRAYFDAVIFDEASQIRPADALPSILRGRQVIVAGDDRQLPPTDFFAGATAEAEDDEELTVSVGAGFESILDAMGPFIDFRMLEWHYRSQDERLIAFSNAYVYDRGLTTFPGVHGDDTVRHVLVPHTPGEIGSEHSSAAEVAAVVDAILTHARTRPSETLGVIAMGVKHANRIDDALRRALVDKPELHQFFDEQRSERFFVKNLERVQGDERDAIILSIGYGKDHTGRLPYRFGPLLSEGGYRRLNVAVTRAKRRMTLVSAFSHLDMDPNRSDSEGVKLLRLYLQYAAAAGGDLGDAALEYPKLNPFEIDVRDSLTKAGIPLTAQYGCSGYFIDFVAADRAQLGRMVLAIECDGASYHSSPTARDRDRLRQDHLERLGWTFHRIWSQDWFNHKEREIRRAVDAYESALTAEPSRTAPEPLQHVIDVEAEVAAIPPRRTLGRPPLRGGAITDYSRSDLQMWVRYVQSDTLLRSEDQLLTDVMLELGFNRRGSRIVAAITDAIRTVRRA